MNLIENFDQLLNSNKIKNLLEDQGVDVSKLDTTNILLVNKAQRQRARIRFRQR
jgi:hypothetical protein